MKRTLAALAICALALGGCQFLADNSEPTTVTPAPVPSIQQAPPGVSLDGPSIAPDVLIDGHFAALENRSFTVRSRIRAEPVDGDSASTFNRTGYVGADPTSFFVDSRLDGAVFGPYGSSRRVIWSDGDATFVRLYREGNLRIESTLPPRDRPPVDGQFRTYLGVILDSMRISSVERLDGTSHYRIEAQGTDSLPDRAVALQFRNVSQVSLRATITAGGLIQRFEVTYEGEFDDHRYQIRRRVRITDVTSTRVPTPGWVNTTRNGTTTASEMDPSDAGAVVP